MTGSPREQNPLPGFESARTWLRAWLDHHGARLGEEQDRQQLYDECWNDLPGVLWPPIADALKRYWFRPLWRGVLKDDGWAFTGGAQGDRLQRLRGMSLDEARAHVLDLLRSASADIQAAREFFEAWAAAWPECEIDVEANMVELRRVAGL